MRIPWYKISKNTVSLRKHVLRVDLCIFIDNETSFGDPAYLESTVKSLLTAAIIKGLDVVGVLSEQNPKIGWLAYRMAIEQNMDLKVIPGQTYKCSTGETLYIYKLQEAVPVNLSVDKACDFAHKRSGYVIAANITKRQVQNLEKLQGSTYAPDAIEIFNDKIGGFKNIDVDYKMFISSGSTTANELEMSNSFTLVDRKELEKMGMLVENELIDYTPKYLMPDNQGGQNV